MLFIDIKINVRCFGGIKQLFLKLLNWFKENSFHYLMGFLTAYVQSNQILTFLDMTKWNEVKRAMAIMKFIFYIKFIKMKTIIVFFICIMGGWNVFEKHN